MKSSGRCVIAAIALLGLASRSGIAETVVCDVTLDPNSPLGWKSAQAAVGDTQEPIAAAFRILKVRYEAAAMTWPRSIAVPAAEAFAALDEGREKVANFVVEKSGTDPMKLRQGVFHGRPYFVELPVRRDDALLCSPEEVKRARVEFATVVQAVSDGIGVATAPAIAQAAERVSELESQFDRYLFEGFPMFPWEAWINSLLLTNEHLVEGPPRYQIVFAHPAAGVIVSTGSGARSDTGATLSLELGAVRYDADYRHWWGISALAVFPGDRDAGYGIAVNYDIFKLGVTWHDDDTGVHDGAAVFLGIDLFKFLDRRYREYDVYLDRLQSLGQLERK